MPRLATAAERKEITRFAAEPEQRAERRKSAPSGKEAKIKDAEERLGVGEELTRCRAVLDLMKLRPDSYWFAQPVPVELIPDYLEIIDTPMDYSTVRKRLDAAEYDDLFAFAADMRLVYTNAVKYAHSSPPTLPGDSAPREGDYPLTD